MPSISKWIFIVIFLLITAAVAGYQLLFSDRTEYKIASHFTARIGREVSIEGPLQIDWHWTRPRIKAFHVRIANMPGAAEPYMADIEEIDLRLKVWKLLLGRTDIPYLRLVRPHFYFEKRNEQHKNWDFPALSRANIYKNIVMPDERSEMPVIGTLRITGGDIVYKDVPRRLEVKLDMDTALGRNKKEQEIFLFRGKGKISGEEFRLDGEGGSLELLRDSRKDFPLALTVSIGKTKFSIDGTFTDPIKLKKLDARLHLSGPNLADLFYLMQIPFPPTPAYHLQGHLKKEGDKWPFTGFSGQIGNSDLAGDVLYDAGPERPILSGTLRSKRLDVVDLGGLIGLPTTGKKRADNTTRLLPDTKLDLNRLRAGDMNLDLSAAKLNAPGWPLSNMHTHIALRKGVLQLDPLRFGIAEGEVDGALHLDGSVAIPRIKTDLRLQRLNLKRFFAGSAFSRATEGIFGGRIRLAASGSSLAKAMAVSDGRIVVTMPGGKISLLLIEALDIDIAQMLPLFLGEDKTTAIHCAVGDFSVRNGLLQSRIFILDTADTNLKGDVNINMKDETMQARLNARPKDVSLLSLQSDIVLTGKLEDPELMLDPVSVGARGAAAAVLGALLPPAAILPFLEPASGEDANCAALLKAASMP